MNIRLNLPSSLENVLLCITRPFSLKPCIRRKAAQLFNAGKTHSRAKMEPAHLLEKTSVALNLLHSQMSSAFQVVRLIRSRLICVLVHKSFVQALVVQISCAKIPLSVRPSPSVLTFVNCNSWLALCDKSSGGSMTPVLRRGHRIFSRGG